MAESKVLSKYYRPDFDPSKITKCSRPSKYTSPKLLTITLIAPFSTKCLKCGEYIYKDRKFNARKELLSENRLDIPLTRFYIRCTQYQAEITFQNDHNNADYICESGAKRNFDLRRDGGKGARESEMEKWEREQKGEEMGKMEEVEREAKGARIDIDVADALDMIRTRNGRHECAGTASVEISVGEETLDGKREKQDKEDEETSRKAFAAWNYEEAEGDLRIDVESATPEVITAIRTVRRKKDYSAAIGICER